jgi:hypothetical protein
VKCGIRRADEVAPLTDGGTLILRRGPYSERAAAPTMIPTGSANETLRCSIAPYSVELDSDEFEDPAGIDDALGERFTTMRTDNGERSRFAGVVAGLFSLGIGVAIGYAALTEAYLPSSHSMSAGRPRNEVAEDAQGFDRVSPEDAETRLVAKTKARKKHLTEGVDVGSLPDAPPAETRLAIPMPAPAAPPQPSDSE